MLAHLISVDQKSDQYVSLFSPWPCVQIKNVSSMTPKSDIIHEAERCGTVLAVAKDAKHKEALVEFKNAGDAGHAYDKLHGAKFGEWVMHARSQGHTQLAWVSHTGHMLLITLTGSSAHSKSGAPYSCANGPGF